jgi:hypothetical protein
MGWCTVLPAQYKCKKAVEGTGAAIHDRVASPTLAIYRVALLFTSVPGVRTPAGAFDDWEASS